MRIHLSSLQKRSHILELCSKMSVLPQLQAESETCICQYESQLLQVPIVHTQGTWAFMRVRKVGFCVQTPVNVTLC